MTTTDGADDDAAQDVPNPTAVAVAVTDDAGAGDAQGQAEPIGMVERFLHPSLNAVALSMMLVVCVRIGMAPLQDNSFLTHLATGRIILDTGSVPTTDPYSWTAYGDPWTVQSWLASVIYAGIEDGAGLVGVRVLATALVMALTIVLWKLTAPAEGLLARSVAMALALVVGVSMWVERPYMFGAVGLALVLLAADKRLDARWLLPILWIWANTHGSYPFAVVILVLLGVGRFLDERRTPMVELRALGWTTAGILLSVAGPLGTDVLTFPLQMVEKREAFLEIREWKPLDLTTGYGKVFVVQLVVAVIALARRRRWRTALPALVFGVAALSSARNVVQASIVLTPVIAVGLHGLGRIQGAARPRIARPLVHGLSVVIVVTVALQLRQPDTSLDPYPRDAVVWMREHDMMDTSSRVVSREVVGNYLEYAYGPDEVRVFMDDRVDMYPIELVRTYLDLLKDDNDHAASLAEVDPSAVLWHHDSSLGRWLTGSDAWDVVWRDDVWMVAVPVDGARRPTG